MGTKHRIYFAHIFLDHHDERSFFVKGMENNDMRLFILSISEGDQLNIRGVGRLEVKDLKVGFHGDQLDENLTYVEVSIYCKWLTSSSPNRMIGPVNISKDLESLASTMPDAIDMENAFSITNGGGI